MTAYYFGGAYEVTGSAVKKYYSFAGQTVAMKDSTGLQYLLTDHLGSVVAITNASGTLTSQQRYLPFGQLRADVTGPNGPSTDLSYTGQRDLHIDLMDYNARFYSSLLGKFIAPDSLATGGPQGLNRYSYVHNNPIRYIDPSGHNYCDLLNNQNLEDCTSGEQRIASKTRRNVPDWDQAFINNVKLRDISSAEAAYLHFINNPSHFASLYIDPLAWSGSDEVAALDLFAGYSDLHMTAEQFIRLSVSPDDADILDRARMLNTQTAGTVNANSNDGVLILAGAAVLLYSNSLIKTDTFHNFPRSFDPSVITNGTITINTGSYTQANLQGTVNGVSGEYEIGWKTQPDGSYLITHRFFRPSPPGNPNK